MYETAVVTKAAWNMDNVYWYCVLTQIPICVTVSLYRSFIYGPPV